MLRRRSNSRGVAGEGDEATNSHSGASAMTLAATHTASTSHGLQPSNDAPRLPSFILSPVSDDALLPDTTVTSSANSSMASSALPSPSHLDRVVTADPLLSKPCPSHSPSLSAAYPASAYDYFSSPTFPASSILSQMLGLSGPNILSFVIQNLIQFSSTLFLGHVSTTALSSAIIGNMICNLTGFSVGLGFTTCLDALCAQAYGGKRYALCGLHAQKGLAMMTIACVPVGLMWLQTGRIALLMGLDEQTAAMAQQWAHYLEWGIWPLFTYQVLARWLAAQRVLWPVVAASVATIAWNIAGNSLFIYRLRWGFQGPAVVMALSYWVMLATCVVCIVGRQRWITWKLRQREEAASDARRRSERSVNVAQSEEGASEADVKDSPVGESTGRVSAWSATLTKGNQYTKLAQDSLAASPASSPQLSSMPAPLPLSTSTSAIAEATSSSTALVSTSDDTEYHDCWPPLSAAIFSDWGEHLRLGLPGAASLFLEWGSYEVSAAFAGGLGGTRLAVHGVFMSSVGLWYAVPLGISSATATMIGNQLGAGEAKNAALTAKIAMLLCLVWGLGNGILFTSFLRPHWLRLFSDDPAVLREAMGTMAILLFYGLADSSKCVLMSILRGCGRPLITVYGNVLSCWFVQFPLAYVFLSYWHLGLVALWTSMTAAWATATLVYGLVLAATDWDDECKKASSRNDAGEGAAKRADGAEEAAAVAGRAGKEVEVWDHKHVASQVERGLSSVESSTDDSDSSQGEYSSPAIGERVSTVSA